LKKSLPVQKKRTKSMTGQPHGVGPAVRTYKALSYGLHQLIREGGLERKKKKFRVKRTPAGDDRRRTFIICRPGRMKKAHTKPAPKEGSWGRNREGGGSNVGPAQVK